MQLSGVRRSSRTKRVGALTGLAALAALTVAPVPLSATPITIIQEYGEFNGGLNSDILVNGVPLEVDGPWTVRMESDTSNPDLDPGANIGVFAATVFLTIPFLSIFDEQVVSPTVRLFEVLASQNILGFTTDLVPPTDGNQGLFVADSTPLVSVGDPNILGDTLPSLDGAGGFALQVVAITLSGGTTLQRQGSSERLSDGGALGATSTASLLIPEPSTALLFATGLAAMAVGRRRRT